MDNLFSVLLGGVIGGLGGTVLTTLFQWWKMRTDREMSLRRDTYFEAATACAKYHDSLKGFLDTDFGSKDHNASLEGGNAAFYKIGLIGKIETIKAFGA